MTTEPAPTVVIPPKPVRWLDSVRRIAPGWVPAFKAVPREWFVPELVWRKNPAGRGWLRVDRAVEPEVWAEQVATDAWLGDPSQRLEPITLPTTT